MRQAPTKASRRSSRKQDAAPTSAERAVQVRPRRSTVKSLEVREVPLPVVRDLIERNHYSRSCPAAALHAFGIYARRRLRGAAVVTIGALRSHSLLEAGRPGDVVTLSRLWLADSLP